MCILSKTLMRLGTNIMDFVINFQTLKFVSSVLASSQNPKHFYRCKLCKHLQRFKSAFFRRHGM